VGEIYTIGTMTSLSKKFPPHAALLVGLLVLLVVAPIIPKHRAGFVAELLFDGVLLAGVYSVGPSRLVGSSLGAPPTGEELQDGARQLTRFGVA